MNKLDKLEDAVIALNKFTVSDKTKWDYKMLCSSLETTLYYAHMSRCMMQWILLIHQNLMN